MERSDSETSREAPPFLPSPFSFAKARVDFKVQLVVGREEERERKQGRARTPKVFFSRKAPCEILFDVAARIKALI